MATLGGVVQPSDYRLAHTLIAYWRNLLVVVLPKKSCIWKAVTPGETIGSSCLRWLKSQRTTKLASRVGSPASWAEAVGAFPHISANAQAAAAATPNITMSAKRPCQALWLLASVVSSPPIAHNVAGLHYGKTRPCLLQRPEYRGGSTACIYARWPIFAVTWELLAGSELLRASITRTRVNTTRRRATIASKEAFRR